MTVTATADVSDAVIGLSNVQQQADTLANTPATVTAVANVGDAVIGLYNLQTQADMLSSTDATLTIMGDATIALAAVDNVNNTVVNPKTLSIGGDNAGAMQSWQSVANLPDLTRSLTMVGDAGAAIATWGIVNNLPDITKTITFNIVTNGSIPSVATAHGGLLHYANGGLIPHIAGEGNRPEMAHYANGGMAILPTEGLYFNPPNTYISPAPANPGIGGGVSVTFTGNFYGSNRSEMDAWARDSLIPAFRDELRNHQRSMGGR